MRFGMILLGLIGILCVVATVSGKDSIYSSWYFILLFTLLGLNLALCSFQRMLHLPAQKRALLKRAEREEATLAVPEPEKWLREHHFREKDGGYLKREAGFLGAFLTHAAMLLLMVAAALLFALAEKQDLNLCVGDEAELQDGTVIRVDDFRMEDESGKTEYISDLSAALPDGSTAEGTAIVNHPTRIGRYTVYQQNYGYAAVIGVKTGMDAEEEPVKLDEAAFLSLDGENGIWYSQMFGNVVEEDGEVKISHGSEIVNPAYEVSVMENGREQTGLIFPGTTVTAGGVFYTFYAPEAYPGLRVKTQPEWALWLLYVSFAMMTAGLYLCFFHIPEAAHIKENGVTIVGKKEIYMQIEQYRAEAQSLTETAGKAEN